MAANSAVDIVNAALLLLGEEPISALSDTTTKAAICNVLYEFVRDDMLGRHRWRFARNKKQLTLDSGTPLGEWTYAYQIPTDMVGEIEAAYDTDAVGAAPFTDWELFGNYLFTDATAVYVDYKKVPDVARWPAAFNLLMVYAMAAHLAEPITEDSSKADMWMRQAIGAPEQGGNGGQLAVARQVDAMGKITEGVKRFDLLAARGG